LVVSVQNMRNAASLLFASNKTIAPT